MKTERKSAKNCPKKNNEMNKKLLKVRVGHQRAGGL